MFADSKTPERASLRIVASHINQSQYLNKNIKTFSLMKYFIFEFKA